MKLYFNHLIIRLSQSAIIALVCLQFLVVVLRYGFDMGFIAMQESVTMLYGWVILMGFSYAMDQDAHVRLDILYQNYSEKTKKWVTVLGIIGFLWPMMGVMLWASMPYVIASWTILEQSRETSGLPIVYLYKTLLVLLPILAFLQSIFTLKKALKS